MLPSLSHIIDFHVSPDVRHLLPLEAPAAVAEAITGTLSALNAE